MMSHRRLDYGLVPFVWLRCITRRWRGNPCREHYCDVIMGAMASQITSLTLVYSTVQSSADQRKHQSSASMPFVRGIHRWSVNSPHKWPVTRKMFPFMMSSWIFADFVCEHCHFFYKKALVPLWWFSLTLSYCSQVSLQQDLLSHDFAKSRESRSCYNETWYQ